MDGVKNLKVFDPLIISEFIVSPVAHIHRINLITLKKWIYKIIY